MESRLAAEDWIRDVYLTLKDFSSVELQYRRWVLGDPIGSYWGEDVSQLLNDLSFSYFLENRWEDTRLSETLRLILVEINNTLVAMIGKEFDFESLQKNETWKSIGEYSRTAISLMEVEARETLRGFMSS